MHIDNLKEELGNGGANVSINKDTNAIREELEQFIAARETAFQEIEQLSLRLLSDLRNSSSNLAAHSLRRQSSVDVAKTWSTLKKRLEADEFARIFDADNSAEGSKFRSSKSAINENIMNFVVADIKLEFAAAAATAARRPLDHKKFLDMLIDEAEEKHIQLLEGTRSHTAVIDDYVKRICTALEDDFRQGQRTLKQL